MTAVLAIIVACLSILSSIVTVVVVLTKGHYKTETVEKSEEELKKKFEEFQRSVQLEIANLRKELLDGFKEINAKISASNVTIAEQSVVNEFVTRILKSLEDRINSLQEKVQNGNCTNQG